MTDSITRDELEGLLDAAVERATKKILHGMGVPDDEKEMIAFRRDISEVRDLLAAWRDTKNVVRCAVVKWMTGIVLLAIAAGSGWGLLHDKLK